MSHVLQYGKKLNQEVGKHANKLMKSVMRVTVFKGFFQGGMMACICIVLLMVLTL